jgi:hypothetical protein
VTGARRLAPLVGVTVAVIGLVLVGIAAATGALAPADRTVTGWVATIDDRSLTEVAGFALRTADGQVLDFDVGRLTLDATSFPAGHLREHRLLNTPVVVTYREESGVRVAVRLQDAPPPGGEPSVHATSPVSS